MNDTHQKRVLEYAAKSLDRQSHAKKSIIQKSYKDLRSSAILPMSTRKRTSTDLTIAFFAVWKGYNYIIYRPPLLNF